MNRAKVTLKWATALAFLALLAVATLVGLGSSLWHLMAAFALAYLCFPLITRLEARGLKRSHASIALIAAVVLVLCVFVIGLAGYLIQEASAFAKALPQNAEAGLAAVQGLAEQMGWEVELDVESLLPQLKEYASSISPDVASSVGTYAQAFFSSTADIVVGVVNLYLIPVFFYYVVNDYEQIIQSLRDLVPRTQLPRGERIAAEANEVLKVYIRGQLVLAGLRALMFGLGLAVLGLDFGLLVGLATGLLTIIPYVGVTLGLACVGLIALTSGAGWGMAIGVALLFGCVTAFDHLWLRPKLIERPSGLGEFGVMLALMIGGNLFGIAGLFLAIPAASVLRIFLRELKLSYQQSALYTGAPIGED